MKLTCQVTAEDMQDFPRAVGAPGSGRLFAYVSMVVAFVFAAGILFGMGTVAFLIGGIVVRGQAGEVMTVLLERPVLGMSVALIFPATPVAIWCLRRTYR